MERLFRDRRHAGRIVAGALGRYAGRSDVVLLALPRGGVPVGFEVARRLDAPLDVFVVRKLGVPGRPELAMGALASGGIKVLNPDVVTVLGVPDSMIAAAVARETAELARREALYRGERPPLDVAGRIAILVDDGLATGATMRAAVAGLRRRGPAQVIVSVPIGATRACEELAGEVDDILCAVTAEPFHAVGMWYADFAQTSDQEVRQLLDASRHRQAADRHVPGAGA